MKKIILFSFLILFGFSTFSQNLDRISLSSGGSSTDQVNYVLGETFNFTVADGANIVIETGTLGSTDNSGGDNNFTVVKEIAETKPLQCYPNPATDFINIVTNQSLSGKTIFTIYDISGKVIKMQSLENSEIQTMNVSNLSVGTYFISVSDNKLQFLGSLKFIKY